MTPSPQPGIASSADGMQYEILKPEELAERWKVPVTWIYEQVRSRAADPLPHVRLGRYIRFQWGCPKLVAWWARRSA